MSYLRRAVVVVGISLMYSAASASDYEITRMPDGPFSFTISGVVLNEGSSMARESILFNDKTCPVQLAKHSLSVRYKDRGFRFVGKTELQVVDAATAIQVRTALYDVFGQHMQNLGNTKPRDFSPGSAPISGEWRASDNDVSELLTTVTYVSRVRLADGTQWVFNADNIQLALSSLNLENKIGDDGED